MKKKALEQAKSKPAAKFFHKGEWFDVLEVKEYNKDELNALQQLHLEGLVDLYAPRRAEACKYKHIADEKGQFISAEYIEGSERMVDLPSHVDQWKDDYKRRFRNGKSTRNR
jgi:hypothetical protein